MCVNQDNLPLNESINGQVYWCKRCTHFSVVFKTSCLLFRKNDFEGFMDLLTSLTADDFKYDLGGEDKVILKHNHSTVGISLSGNETTELKELMAEALLIYEATKLLTYGN